MGIILYYLAYGSLPFSSNNKTEVDLINEISNKEYALLTQTGLPRLHSPQGLGTHEEDARQRPEPAAVCGTASEAPVFHSVDSLSIGANRRPTRTSSSILFYILYFN